MICCPNVVRDVNNVAKAFGRARKAYNTQHNFTLEDLCRDEDTFFLLKWCPVHKELLLLLIVVVVMIILVVWNAKVINHLFLICAKAKGAPDGAIVSLNPNPFHNYLKSKASA